MHLICDEQYPRREGETLIYTAEGYSAKEAARRMGCSIHNIESLRNSILNRMKARNMCHAVAEAFKLGHLKYIPVFILCFITGFSGMDERTRVRTGHRARVVTVWRAS